MKKISLEGATVRRIRDAFDFLKVHESELTEGQRELIKSFRKQFNQRGLSEKQTDCLFNIQRYLKPASTIRIINE